MVLAVLLTDPNWIWQTHLYPIFGFFDFDPSAFDPVRQDSAVLVVSRRLDLSSKRSNPRAAKQVRSIFFTSAFCKVSKRMKVNKR